MPDPSTSRASPVARPVVIRDAAVVTLDADRREMDCATVRFSGNRITHVEPGPLDPALLADADIVDGTGCVLTPGLVNCHHHLYQWITRGLAADSTLFDWLTTLYPIWARLDETTVHAAALGGLSSLVSSGCTTTTDHHYVFPAAGGDLLGAEIAAADELGIRFHPTRGSMDLSEKDGGLPPDSVVQTLDDVLAASAAAIERWHDPAPDAMVRIALAPCSPFSVTPDLLRETASLARATGVRLHTHLAESLDENDYCAERFGMSPLEYLESLDWVGPDVWLAHGIEFTDGEIARLAATRTGIAHCPTSNARLGNRICRTRELVAAGVPVGLGVDGAASNESCRLLEEAHQALMMARARGGPDAMTTRTALELATLGGARLLGREADLGSIAVGKLADVVLWDLTTLAHVGIDDPVVALTLGSQPPIRGTWVDGRRLVADDTIVSVDAADVVRRVGAAHRGLVGAVG